MWLRFACLAWVRSDCVREHHHVVVSYKEHPYSRISSVTEAYVKEF
jgi:hypothetical protein